MASDVRVALDSVQVTDGQGVGEGNFELRIQVLEQVPLVGNVPKVIWPSISTTSSVNNNGTVKRIDREVETYRLSSSLSRSFLIIAEEEDTGTLGQDEVGQNSVVFDLEPGMCRTTRSALITLRNNGGNEGQVRVTLSAEAA